MPTLIGYPFERLLYFYHCILHVYKSLLSVASFGAGGLGCLITGVGAGGGGMARTGGASSATARWDFSAASKVLLILDHSE